MNCKQHWKIFFSIISDICSTSYLLPYIRMLLIKYPVRLSIIWMAIVKFYYEHKKLIPTILFHTCHCFWNPKQFCIFLSLRENTECWWNKRYLENLFWLNDTCINLKNTNYFYNGITTTNTIHYNKCNWQDVFWDLCGLSVIVSELLFL